MNSFRWTTGLVLIAAVCLNPAVAEVDLSSPRAAYKSYAHAILKLDEDALRQTVLIQSDDQKLAVDAYINSLLAAQQLATASKQRFGSGTDQIARDGISEEFIKEIDTIRMTETDGVAEFRADGSDRPLIARKIENEWKIDLIPRSSPQLPAQIKLVNAISQAMRETAVEIERGRYNTPADAEAALQQRLHTVIARNLPPATRPSTQPAK